jgi:carbamate kinase
MSGARLVVALGGNALMAPGSAPDTRTQRRNVARSARFLAPIARENELVVTHGNGPQVGLLALQAEATSNIPAPSLDELDAETEGLIGYLIDQALSSELPDRLVVTMLTQVEVDPEDPAFGAPSKPIGPVYDDEEAARAVERQRNWSMARDRGGFRRVVPSPQPRRIRELEAIRLLLEVGAIVICAGGGGIPVVVEAGGGIRGIEGVIDKDLTAALLGQALGADTLLLLTDVDAVYENWETSEARPIHATSPRDLRRLTFATGSMAPKVEAACRFVEAGGGLAVIGALEEAAKVLSGTAGTRITAA